MAIEDEKNFLSFYFLNMEEGGNKVDLDLVEERFTSHQPSFSLEPSDEEVLSDEEMPMFEPPGYLEEFADVVESTCPTHRSRYQAARWEESP